MYTGDSSCEAGALQLWLGRPWWDHRFVRLKDLARLDSAALEPSYEVGTVHTGLGALGEQPDGGLLAVWGRDRSTNVELLRYLGDRRHSPLAGRRAFVAEVGRAGAGANRNRVAPTGGWRASSDTGTGLLRG